MCIWPSGCRHPHRPIYRGGGRALAIVRNPKSKNQQREKRKTSESKALQERAAYPCCLKYDLAVIFPPTIINLP
jgi:hypothetical protein